MTRQEHAEASPAKPRKRHRTRRVVLVIVVVLVALVAAFALGIHLYASDYYHAQPNAIAAEDSSEEVTVTRLGSGDVTFVPAEVPVTSALVFYPGGKVEADAYAPLLGRLAQHGVACVLVRMPENLAVLAPNSADRARGELEQALADSDAPNVPWLMAGHSLGGAMAASYVAGHADSYQGLVLLAAYSTKDLSGTSVRTLSIYGSNDGVLNRKRYQECLPNLGNDVTELVIDGGIHSYFGEYGHQEGDGEAAITNDQQLDQAADAVASFVASLG